jgi:hypothetical protein
MAAIPAHRFLPADVCIEQTSLQRTFKIEFVAKLDENETSKASHLWWLIPYNQD